MILISPLSDFIPTGDELPDFGSYPFREALDKAVGHASRFNPDDVAPDVVITHAGYILAIVRRGVDPEVHVTHLDSLARC